LQLIIILCRSTGNTPSRLLFGLDQLGEIHDFLRLSLDSQTKDNRNLAELRAAVSCKIVENQTANEKTYNKSQKIATTYQINDYVDIINVDTIVDANKKLIPKYKGPYVVSKVLGADRYIIIDIPGFQIIQRCGVHRQ